VYYAPKIFQNSGTKLISLLQTILVGAVNLRLLSLPYLLSTSLEEDHCSFRRIDNGIAMAAIGLLSTAIDWE
jgi:hypothetical protein